MNLFLEIVVSNAVVAGILTVLVAGLTRMIRQPVLAHTLWILVLLKLLTPPIVKVPISWPTAAEGSSARASDSTRLPEFPTGQEPRVTTAAETAEQAEPVTGEHGVEKAVRPGLTEAKPQAWWRSTKIQPAVVSCWLVGSGLWFILAGVRMVRFHWLLSHGRPDPWLQERACQIAGRMGMDWCPDVWLVPARISPLLWTFGAAARLIIPEPLLVCLEREQLGALLAHELAHARRRDHWVRWIEFAVLGVYWWHPAVWWARNELRQAEEQCCDAWVLWTLPGTGRAYAEALLETTRFLTGARSTVPALASGIGYVSVLRRRLTMILHDSLSHRMSWPACLVTVLFGLAILPWTPCTLAAGSAAPALAPTQAEQEPGDLERRLTTLEQKMDRVLRALESLGESRQPGTTDPERGDRQAADSKKRQELAAEREARQKARAAEAAARQAEFQKARDLQKLAQEAARQAREQAGAAAADARKQVEQLRQQAGLKGPDPERMVELGREIEALVKNAINPQAMEELGRQIERAIHETRPHLSPDREEEFEREIEQAVKRAVNPEQMEQLGRRIEEAVERAMKVDRLGEAARRTGESKDPQPKRRARAAEPAGPGTDIESRMRTLEEKMDRVLKALESDRPQ